MAYFRRHTKRDAEKSSRHPIKFPTKDQLIDELTLGVTAKYVSDVHHIPTSEFKYMSDDIRRCTKEIKRSPIPPNVDKGDWKILSELTSDAKKSYPLASLKYVCSRKFGKDLRLVYEIYDTEDCILIIFTNLNIHIYRNRLYSITTDYYFYRNKVVAE